MIDGARTKVVLKIFYRADKVCTGAGVSPSGVPCPSVTKSGDCVAPCAKQVGKIEYLGTGLELSERERKVVKKAVQECGLVRKLIRAAPDDDPGKHRFVNCLHERVSQRPPGAPLYLVLEHGGTSLKSYIKAQASAPTASDKEKRLIVGQLLQGVRTLGERYRYPMS